jgi:uncharacterized protein YigA (DUF484 family)
MSGKPELEQSIRDSIIADPEAILEDRDVMRALAAANSGQLGGNVVDIRGVAIERLEARLDRLEDTHRSVIAAAYENLAGTNQIHRAVLALLEPREFEDFLKGLGTEVAGILRVDSVRLVLETMQSPDDPVVGKLGDILAVVEPGFVADYVGASAKSRRVVLRQTRVRDDRLFGDRAAWIRSEACLQLDFGNRRLPGMLVLASEDPHMFKPTQGTDLLTFFAGVFERSMRRWLG